MLELSIIVWDLETVPVAAAARLLDLPGAPEAEVREALGSDFIAWDCERYGDT